MKSKPKGARRKTNERTVKLYHRTGAAAEILEKGFRDGEGNYLTMNIYRGVWLSNVPLDENEGAQGDALLEVKVTASFAELAAFEWIEEGKPYREWLVPAAWLNKRSAIRLLTDEEEFELEDELRQEREK